MMGTTNGSQPQAKFDKHQDKGGRANMEDMVRAERIKTASEIPLTVLMVADGVGGHSFGEKAAELCTQTVFAELAAAELTSPDNIPNLMQYALEKANETVYQTARQNKEMRGMGTTATLAIIHACKLYLANVGDSRAYLLRNNQLIQISRDHTWGREMVAQKRLTAEEAARHPKAEELVRSIGYEPEVKVDVGLYLNGDDDEDAARQTQGVPLQTNDRLLLCSDGLIKERADKQGHYVEAAEIQQLLTRHAPTEAAQALVEQAVQRKADDNVSAIVWEAAGSKKAFYLPPQMIYAGLGGVALLLVVGLLILAALIIPRPSPDPTAAAAAAEITEATPTPGPTQPPPVSEVLTSSYTLTIVQVQDGVTAQDGDDGSLTRLNGVNSLEVGTNKLTLSTPAETIPHTQMAHLRLPDGSQLFVGAQTTLIIQAVAGHNGAEATLIRLEQGKFIWQGQTRVEVKNPYEAKASNITSSGENSVMGIIYTTQPFRFELHCLIGDCRLEGDLGGVQSLMMGQSSYVGGSGKPEGIQGADYLNCSRLAPGVVPTPTPTPESTPTPTETPTLTPSATPTLRLGQPPGPTSTPTITDANTSTPTASAEPPPGPGPISSPITKPTDLPTPIPETPTPTPETPTLTPETPTLTPVTPILTPVTPGATFCPGDPCP